MAKFKVQLPTEIIKDFEKINKNTSRIFGEMTEAGAKVVAENMRNNAPTTISGYIKITKIYRTPSNGAINTKAYVKGYIPFSNPNRKGFTRSGGSGKSYTSTEGVPAEFLAMLYEYGRTTAPFPKHPFLRKSFKKKEIEQAMLEAQVKASGGLLDE